MSLSKDERQKNANLALSLLLAATGNNRISTSFHRRDDSAFKNVHNTTWVELEEQRLINSLLNHTALGYSLTANGWIKAVRDAGLIRDQDFLKKLGSLSRVIKGHVKGRHAEVMINLQTVASEAGLAENWIYNVIESNMLEVVFAKRGATWLSNFKGQIIKIPITFGLDV